MCAHFFLDNNVILSHPIRQSLDHQSWDRSAILGSYILGSHGNVRVIPNVVFHKESLGHTAHGPLATLYLHLVGGSLEL